MNVSTQEAEPAARRSQAARRGESDRRMLQAATRLIARRGVTGTSLADVGVAAGYSRGLPGERFGTKVGLIGTLLEAMDTWFQSHLARVLEGKSGLEALLLRIDAHLGSAARSAAATAALYSIYMESLCVMPELKAGVAAFTDRRRDGLIANLREGQKRREIRAGIDCVAEATFLLATMRGLMIQQLMEPSAADLGSSRAILLSGVHERLAAPRRKSK